MDPESSPPKRVTRARAAAKKDTKTEPKIMIATASTRVKATKSNTDVAPPPASAPVPRTRRTRAASHVEKENNDEDMHQEDIQSEEVEKPKKPTRGRPKKVSTLAAVAKEAEDEMREELGEESIVVAPLPAAKVTRGRQKKTEDEAVPAPIRATRGRPKKVEVSQPEVVDAVAPVKRAARGRPAATTTKAAAPKKTVSFDDAVEDKENVHVLDSKSKAAQATTGVRGRVVRKAPIPARATRAKAAPPTQPKSAPLSPKKITQVSPTKTAENVSEDELATMEKTPMKPLSKSPIKPMSSLSSPAKRLGFSTSIIANRVELPGHKDLNSSLFGSPARRLPQSAHKASLKSSPQRVAGETSNPLLKSPFRPNFSISKATAGPSTSSFKGSLMASPARRTASPIKPDIFGSPQNLRPGTTPFKNSLISSPARRAPIFPTKVSTTGSPGKAAPSLNTLGATPKASTFSMSRFATPKTLNRNAFRPGKIEVESTTRPATEVKKGDNALIKPFPGRLSAVMPRSEDHVVSGEGQVENLEQDDVVAADEEEEPTAIGSTTPTASPPRNSIGTGVYSLRANQLDPIHNSAVESESESEDELASGNPQYSPVPMSFKSQAPCALTPFMSIATTPSTRQSRENKNFGFTPLARQLSDWMGASPEKSSKEHDDASSSKFTGAASHTTAAVSAEDIFTELKATTDVSPSKIVSNFFEEEMEIREEEDEIDMLVAYEDNTDLNEILGLSESTSVGVEDAEAEIDAMTFAPQHLDAEDLDLAAEAEELSLLDFTAGEADAEEEEVEELGSDDEVDILGLEVTEYLRDHAVVPQLQQQAEECQKDDGESFVQDESFVSQQEDALDESQFEEDHADVLGIEVTEYLYHEAVVTRPEDNEEQQVDDFDTEMSETSQDYGDENAAPVSPAPYLNELAEKILVEAKSTPKAASRPRSHATPVRSNQHERIFHTVSKVPLKPAAADSPFAIQARALTSARPVPQRAAPPAPIVSRTPTRRRSVAGPSTPAQWSTAADATPTPRRDLSNNILKGAVVFVDVHTTEGADASAVFVELLTSMGARCVKTWTWNPEMSSPNAQSTPASGKIGITHVVFKDGGKRTIERVRATAGVVQCVGVGWVLDCERCSEWVAEAPYEIDTSLVPRGGHRRRKSMEPRALQNLNGNLVEPKQPAVTPRSVSYAGASTPSKTPGTTKSRKSVGGFDRRRSTQWIRSPVSEASSNSGNGDSHSPSDETMILSPLPRTPAAEAVAEYAEHILDGEGEPTPYQIKNQSLVQRTMPVKRFNDEEDQSGGLISGQNENERGFLMQRLLLARRKSLQWAPKVGSPLKDMGTFSP